MEEKTISSKAKTNINEHISEKQVRLIDNEGNQHGVVPIEVALEVSRELKLDLVEVANGNNQIAVCKIMDYGKHLFEQKQKSKENKKKQKKTQVKEIKLRPATDVGDYQVKLRNLIRFLEDGDKAKVTIRFRGREMSHQNLGVNMLKRIEEDLKDYAYVESRAKLEGRQMTMILSPLKKK